MATLTIIVYLMIMLPLQRCIQKNYYNYSLYRAVPVNENQLSYLKKLSSLYDVNYWRQPSQVDKVMEFVISPRDKSEFIIGAEQLGIHLTELMEDIQKTENSLFYIRNIQGFRKQFGAFDEQTVKIYIRRRMEEFDWRSYFKADDIQQWLYDLANEYPHEVHLESIGKTIQNRDILAMRILVGSGEERPRVIVEGGIHAREWISPAFVTYMIQQLLKASSSNNNALKEIAVTYEWYFVPVLNPDGYEISHTSDRLWRKNSRGVDLNRNFGIAFGTTGISKDKRSETYCGDKAFSEHETQAMASFVRSKSDRLAFYLAFHSYGQYMIIPYTHSKTHVENFDEVHAMCKRAAVKIADRYGTGYTYGTAFDTIGYLTSGVSGCWVKKNFKVPYVITFELRDEGHYGFALPTTEILPTCEETMDGVLSLLSPNNTPKYKKLDAISKSKSGPAYIYMDGFVTVSNIVLFALLRFN